MRPTGPQPAEETGRRREPHAGRGYARRIDCDGGGYAATPASPPRSEMREPAIWNTRRSDPER